MKRRRMLKNAHAEAEQFRRRAALAFAGVVLALAGLAGWYFRLQVLQYDDYALRSEANRVKLLPVVPGRGLIYDRKGRVLADNVPAYRLDVVPDEAGDPERWLPALQRVVALTPEDVARFRAERRAKAGFRPITLKLRVSDEEAARFAVDRWRFPGVELVSYLNRRYPHGDLFAHVIGYVGRIDEKDLATLGEGDAALTHIGKTGLERYYEPQLRGRVGFVKMETNVEGRAMGEVGRVPATPGADLRLSIDLDLQRAAVMAFGELQGSAVAVDPRTGEVLAMVSLPAFDPNLFVNGISTRDYRPLITDPARPLFNRNVLGGVAPGSTLKPLIALAGLDAGLRTPEDRVLSTGEFRIPGQRRGYRDSHVHGHGWTDLRKSIADSVNTYYYRLSLDMGIETFDRYMDRYGFGKPTGIDLTGEIGGILPSPDWKRANRKEPWYPGDTVISSIGQGFWKATPLQLAQAAGALANGGLLRKPHLVRELRAGFEAPWTAIAQPAPARISDSAQHVGVVQDGMTMTVHGPGGTARAIGIGIPYRIAGKTGTAQVISRKGSASLDPRSLPMHLRHRALFVGFAPAENPTIALAVVVEGGGYGSSTAAPIARKIFDAWILGTMPVAPDAEATGEIVAGSRDSGLGTRDSESRDPESRDPGLGTRDSESRDSRLVNRDPDSRDPGLGTRDSESRDSRLVNRDLEERDAASRPLDAPTPSLAAIRLSGMGGASAGSGTRDTRVPSPESRVPLQSRASLQSRVPPRSRLP
ncbi:penicillin-binding protein 2 [Tolypothrix campylonemoides VB511288]|nr:penicillin-binding protein 2 [Tolypothrix campylonemoides VB511288]